MRLRRKAKWIYVLLAVLFAITFAFLGVGSGTSGGLDQLFQNINIFGPAAAPSVSKAQKDLKNQPKRPEGLPRPRDRVRGEGRYGQRDQRAPAVHEHEAQGREGWSELAGLQTTQAQNYLADYQNAYTGRQLAAPSQSFFPTGKLATALGTNPIETGRRRTRVRRVGQDLQQQDQLAYNGAVSSWQKVTKLQPKNSDAWFQLARRRRRPATRGRASRRTSGTSKLNPESSSARPDRAADQAAVAGCPCSAEEEKVVSRPPTPRPGRDR